MVGASSASRTPHDGPKSLGDPIPKFRINIPCPLVDRRERDLDHQCGSDHVSIYFRSVPQF